MFAGLMAFLDSVFGMSKIINIYPWYIRYPLYLLITLVAVLLYFTFKTLMKLIYRFTLYLMKTLFQLLAFGYKKAFNKKQVA